MIPNLQGRLTSEQVFSQSRDPHVLDHEGTSKAAMPCTRSELLRQIAEVIGDRERERDPVHFLKRLAWLERWHSDSAKGILAFTFFRLSAIAPFATGLCSLIYAYPSIVKIGNGLPLTLATCLSLVSLFHVTERFVRILDPGYKPGYNRRGQQFVNEQMNELETKSEDELRQIARELSEKK